MKIKSLIILTALTACGQGPKEFSVDPEFLTFVERFEDDALRYGNISVTIDNINISFGDVQANGGGPHAVAVCLTNFDKPYAQTRTPIIIVNEEYWHLLDKDQSSLIYHELGHCVLHREHRNDDYDYHSLSLMNPYIAPGFYKYEKQYLTELFTSPDKAELYNIWSAVFPGVLNSLTVSNNKLNDFNHAPESSTLQPID